MNDYIEELKAMLTQLGAQEQSDVLDFYTEYLQDGQFVTYTDCVRELGTPRQLARKVLADYSIKNLNTASQSGSRANKPKDDVKTIWLIALAVLSTPITIPLAFGAVGLFIAAIAVAVGILAAIFGVGFGVIFGGLVSLVTGLGVVSNNFWVGIFYLGVGLIAAGAIIMLIPAFRGLVDGVIHGITVFSKWMYSKIVKKNRAEKHGRGQQK
ncbi:DUF1700 domain-containing protein [Lentilactobacillus hilgardii]|uniref:DUF1700 domain-containing protein n=1 Tax=Lentilactobacillus hilgardii TaxID=1588 RepID=UPI0021C36D8B|nr:DUF1700 domain-containing protein [Lentilactobacillus hilgardii]MCP9331969.1 DUF1700 domain-containing protein [Lentilactobacillus hilgardii]MCP9348557.1 DUF1700 domain-containing protein [Lentilactobacillus hilgardii]MCP9351404.1 DUF1700 domain-containing protein [Lentilactobacillus hilgardii]